ncbi:Nuclear receptor domain-containing protein [Aphelenchoides bicaudatus]|nr:Nuclear receptor domain-containing protein [Aphelenchoides bicaudatus]
MNNPDNWFPCGVCGEKTRFCYLKAQLCRACAAFYRRAVTEGIKYDCPMEEKCKLESMLDVLSIGYDWFLDKQKQRHVERHPKVDFTNGKLKLVKNRKLGLQMESDCLPFMFSMFDEYYGAFAGLSRTQKLSLTAHVAYEMAHLNMAYLTSKHFPQIEDSRMAITNGYYVEVIQVDIAGYVYGLFMNKELEQFINIYQPLSRRRYRNLQRFKQLGLGKADAVCMIFLTMCRQIEYLGYLSPEVLQMREQLLREWFELVKQRVGPKNANLQFGRIFHYYLECNNLCNDFAKTLTVLALQNSNSDKKMLHDPANCLRILNESQTL